MFENYPYIDLGNTISIKDDQNPFFTSNTSLTFNWGGTSDKVNTAMTILRSRSHNEEVVEKLQFYINYLEQGEYQRVDAYGNTPFKIIADTNAFQANNVTMNISMVDEITFNINANVPAILARTNYKTKETDNRTVEAREFNRNFKIGEHVNLPFFSGYLERTDNPLNVGKGLLCKFYAI